METCNYIFDWIFEYLLKVSVQVFAAASIFALNQEKRKYFLLRYIPIAIAYYFVFVIMPGNAWWLSIMSQHITETLTINHFYTVTYLITILIIWFCFKIKLQGAILYSTCAYLIQHMSSNIGWAVMNVIDIATAGTFELHLRPLVMLISYLALVAGLYAFLTHNIKKKSSIEIVNVGGLALATFEIIFVAYCRQIFSDLLSGINGNTTALMVFYNIFASIICIVLLFLLINIFEKKDIKRENRELELLLAVQNNVHKRSAESIELLNIRAHDLKKQIEYLHDLDDETTKREILENVEKSIKEYDEIVESGCKALDHILTEKVHACRKHNIIFTYMIDGTALNKMKSSDIFSLFSNALDNAIEGVLEYGDDKRVISLKVMKQGKITVVNIENYCDKEIVYDSGFPITTKKNKNVHGFGLKSINYIVHKYDGAIKIKNENKMFRLTMVLPD